MQIQCCSQVYLGGLSQGAWTKAPWSLVSHWHQYSPGDGTATYKMPGIQLKDSNMLGSSPSKAKVT